MLEVGKQESIQYVALVQVALPLLSPATTATILRPIGQLPPRQVKGLRHHLQLKHHLEINILHARFTDRFFKCPLLIAHKDKDLIP